MSFLSFFSWLGPLVNHGSRATRRDRPASHRRAATSRPRLEFLEDRTLPATITWTGATDNSNWHLAGNWDLGRVPGAVANDDVVILDRAGTSLITYFTGSTAIRSLASQEAIELFGGSLSIGASGAFSRIDRELRVSGGTLEFKNTALDGPGLLINTATLTMTGSTLYTPLINQDTLLAQGSTVSGSLDNRGTLLAQGTSAINGNLTTATGSTLRVQGSNAGDAALTVARGFTNSGAIELTSIDTSKAATLTVTSGTLTNAAGANLRALPGTGGARSLFAQLDNPGTLTVAQDLGLDITNRTFNNSGKLDIASGRTLTVGGGTFNLQTGTVTGSGALSLYRTIANLARSFSNAVTGLALWESIVNGPGTLTNAAGKWLSMTSSIVNAPLINQGTLFVLGWRSEINGALTTEPGSEIEVFGSGAGSPRLTVANGFTSNGTIKLSEGDDQYERNAGLTVSNGTLINAASIIVFGGPGRYDGGRYLNAQLDNRGYLGLGASLHIDNTGRTFRNSGAIDIGPGNKTLYVNGGTFDPQSGTVTGRGTLQLSGVTANLTTAFSPVVAWLTLSSSTVNGPGTLTNAPGNTLYLTGSTMNASLVNQGTLLAQASNVIKGDLTTATDSILRVQGTNAGNAALTIDKGFTNSGAIELTSADASWAATLTVSSGTLIIAAEARLSTLPGTGRAHTLNARLDNRGTLSVAQDLTISSGALTNLSAGTLTGGTYHIARTFKFPNAAITSNAATIVLDGPNARIVNQPDGDALTNFATNSAGGRFTIQNGRNFTTAATVAFTNAGILTVGTGSTFTVTGSLTNFENRTLTGGTYEVSGTLKFPGADIRTLAAALVLDGSGSTVVNLTNGNALTYLANISAAGRFIVRNGRNFSAAGAFTNAGSLTVGAGSSFAVTENLTNFRELTLTGGTYEVSGTLKFPRADIRTLAAGLVLDGPASQIVNQTNGNGLANFARNAAAGSFTLRNGRNFTTVGDFTNEGSVTVGSGSIFTVTGRFTQTAGSTTLSGGTLATNYVKDPGFEMPPGASPWTFDGYDRGVAGVAGNYWGNPPPPEGNQVALLMHDGIISQSISLPAGTYTVRFKAAQRYLSGGGRQGFHVLVNGTTYGTFTPSSFDYADYTTSSFEVPTGVHTLRFQGWIYAGGHAAFIDQVRIMGVVDIQADSVLTGFGTINSHLVNAGQVNAGGNVTASLLSVTGNYTQTAGTLTGAGNLAVAGRLTWTAGTMSGSGQTLANGGLDLRGAADKVLTQRTLSNAGSATWTDTGHFILSDGATFINQAGATFDIQNDAVLSYGSGTVPTVSNRGTFRKSIGTGTTRLGDSVRFTNTGTVEVRSGTLFLEGLFTNFVGTTFTGGTYLVTGTLKFAGANIGTNAADLVLDGPNSQIVDHAGRNGLANFATNAATGRFIIQNGRNFSTTAAVTFTNAGTLNVRTGTTFTVAGSFANFASSTSTLTGGTYVVGGTLKFNDADIRALAANLVLDGAVSRIINQADENGFAKLTSILATGSFTIQNGRTFITAGAFANEGSVTVEGATSTLTVTGRYMQTATAANTTLLNGGTLTARSGANTETVNIQAGLLAGSGTINAHLVNAGQVNPGGIAATGVLKVTGNYSQTGTLTVGAGSTFIVTGRYTQTAGTTTLSGGTLSTNYVNDPGFETPPVGTGFWDAFQTRPSGSPWTFTGSAGVAGNGSGFTIGNPNAPEGSQVAFLQTGADEIGSMSQSVYLPSGTYTISFKAAQRANVPSRQTFRVLVGGNVLGTFTPGGTSYAEYTTVSFTVLTGVHPLRFEGLTSGGDHTAFIDQVRLIGTVDIQGGVLEGSGTIDAHLVNAGQVNPGDTGNTRAAGTLIVTGNYTQRATGTLNIDLGGPGAGQYDQLRITGTATLGGTLNIRLFNYQLKPDDSFQAVLLFSSRSGVFDRFNGQELSPTLDLVLSFEPATNPVRLTLVTQRKP